ncbi:MAG: YmdB family metallophosphoesterase [Desulfovibrionaceae bacterium]
MRLLHLGDIMGRPGRQGLRRALPALREEFSPDMVIANVENASGGVGLTVKGAAELLGMGLDVLTSGNHIWKYREIYAYLDGEPRLLRPANYPPGAPGAGCGVFEARNGVRVAVGNLLGRTFMDAVDCPFQVGRAMVDALPADVRVRLIDLHAEATSEKKALAYFLDGAVSAVLGTHTHVPTADAQVLRGGTGYMTDIGMCGVHDSSLGMDIKAVIARFVTGLPTRFELAAGPVLLQGAVVEVDPDTGRCLGVTPFSREA